MTSRWGKLDVDSAREEGGRWIVPATFDLYTSSRDRTIEAKLGDEEIGDSSPCPKARPRTRKLELLETGTARR